MRNAREYTVVSSFKSSPTSFIVRVQDAKKRPALQYAPGQYAAISFVHNGRPTPIRCFSITSSPSEQDGLEFGMHVLGNFTHTAAKSLQPGAKVVVEGPFGSCVLDKGSAQPLVMLAGGIGITPFVSMLRYASRLQLTTPITLVYSCHSQDDIPFVEEILALQGANPHIKIVFAISTGEAPLLTGQTVIYGRLTAKALSTILGGVYDKQRFYICGSPNFMNSVSGMVRAAGAPADHIIREAFSQGDPGPRALKHNLSVPVYALTGLSIVLSTGAILYKDATKKPMNLAANYNSSAATLAAKKNSRQSVVDKNLSELQQGRSAPTGAAPSSTVAPSPGTPTSPTGGTPQPTTPSTKKGATGSTTPSSPSPSSSTPSVAPSTTPATGPPSSTPGSSTPPSTPTTSPSPSPSPTPTPAPTPVAPSVNFGASSTSITSGQSAMLSWNTNSNATAPVNCAATNGWSGAKSSSGSQSVSPSSTTTYTLMCSNSAGSSTKSVTINVQPSCVSTPSAPC